MRRRTDLLAENECYVLSVYCRYDRTHITDLLDVHIAYPDCCGKSDTRIRKNNPMAINKTEGPAAVCIYCPRAMLNARNCIDRGRIQTDIS